MQAQLIWSAIGDYIKYSPLSMTGSHDQVRREWINFPPFASFSTTYIICTDILLTKVILVQLMIPELVFEFTSHHHSLNLRHISSPRLTQFIQKPSSSSVDELLLNLFARR